MVGRRDGKPIWINRATREAKALDRVTLQSDSGYDEDWLQNLIHAHPEVLPIGQIEPDFGAPIPLCRELPLIIGAGRAGALDNLLITRTGGLILVEAKLWRNPEARRAVIAQAIEYAAGVFRLSYAELESAVLRALGPEPHCKSIFETVASRESGIDEAEFVDAVARNLRRGRAIVTVVGDGIREDITPMAELLQSHAGHRFTFALVELAIYQSPETAIHFVTPSVLAQTALIERGVVQIEESASGERIAIREAVAKSETPTRAIGISEDEFYEALDRREAGFSQLLKAFLAKAVQRGMFVDMQSALNIKHPSPKGNALNLGTIYRDGFVETSPATWWDRTAAGRKYNEHLADLIGGNVREMKDHKESAVRTSSWKTPRISDLLPAHEDEWLRAMDEYIKDVFASAEEV
ncbi:hypothetical protein [Nitrobacter sp. TKz-YC01]|uniref:hypothetical protein n=1 Tax=Nitrobacter sp. TKz-YC01 TaxID=3398703 RepID=UPI003A0FFE1D